MDGEEYKRIISLIQDSSPKLTYCEWFDENDSLWDHTRHSHPYIELIYYVDGKGSVGIGDAQVNFSLYDTIVYPAYVEHRDAPSPERKREIICLWVDIPELVLPGPIHLNEREGMLNNAFRNIYREARRKTREPVLLEYAIKQLLIIIFRECYEADGRNRTFERVLEYIQNHYMEKLTLEELAGLEYISKSYLSRKFRQLTGDSVIGYINAMRIQKASELLISTSMGVDEIGALVGFDSPKYFCRVFKEKMQETPSNFRKRYRAQSGI
ncbi:MAG: AraC family transcriptional regulator [Lachnospiraceae bacterium]|nr:AraC family transcriptional regulator [Lachnospiraceae bacterium]